MTGQTGLDKTAIVVDASVVVAAVSPDEPGYPESLALLGEIHRRRVVLKEPAQFLFEIYAVLTRSPSQLRELGFMTIDDPLSIEFKPLDAGELERALGWLTSTFPGECPTRGGDLTYVWVARQAAVPLVTLDAGLHKFRSPGLDIRYPREQMRLWEDEVRPDG